MEIMNMKPNGVALICGFPPEHNLNIYSLTYLSGKLEVAKRNKFWIAFTVILGYLGIAFIQYRLSFGSMEPIDTTLNYSIGTTVVFIAVTFIMVILAALCFGKSTASGRTRITRSTAESVDGFGGARARDFSHMPPGHSDKGGFPVSLRKERQRTATFREGAKDRVDDEKGRENHD